MVTVFLLNSPRNVKNSWVETEGDAITLEAIVVEEEAFEVIVVDAEASEEKAEVDSAAGLKAGQATTDQARL